MERPVHLEDMCLAQFAISYIYTSTVPTRLKGFSPNRGKRLEGLGVLQGLGALEAGGLGELVVLGGLG